MKKRIGVIMYQTSKSKGQELVAQRMVYYFNRLGHDAHLITSIYHDGKEVVNESVIGEKGYVRVEDSELGIPIIRVSSLITKWPPRRIGFKDVVHVLEGIVNDFGLNVLITHSTLWNGPEEVAKFVEWRRNIKALGGLQDPLVFCHMSHYQEPSPRRYSVVERSFRMAWNRLSLRQVLRVANLILVVTPYEKIAKVKMGAPQEKCILFPGGVDDEAFLRYASLGPEELIQRLKLDVKMKLVSYLGSIEERKNPKAILDVAQKLVERKDIHFIIAGRGETEYVEQVQTKAAELANVTYLGEISEREKIQLIKASYLNIILSRMEALGLTQFEFMFDGVPVITSGVGGQSWIVKNGEEGILVKGPGDIDGAAQAITRLADEPAEWQKFSANAKAKAKPFALSKLVAVLDEALTRELERESGLSTLPPEVRSSLSEPEVVAKSWSHGAQKVVATNRRIFIQQGRLSRRTLEMRYSGIEAIEHIRRYPLKVLMTGLALSTLLFIQHYYVPVISRRITSEVVDLTTLILPTFRYFIPLVLVLPAAVGCVLFLYGSRNGYALHRGAMKSVYLPQPFGKAVKYVREMQDRIPPNGAAKISSAKDDSVQIN
jgi:D-inositol-3-phosphate glycosyltransferase